MKVIDYKEELSSYCVFDDAQMGDRVATFLSSEKADDGENVIWKFYCSECEAEEEHIEEITEDYIYIASCPLDENPFDKYTTLQTCRVFIKQLANVAKIPEGGSLEVRAEYGGGGYYEVVAKYTTLLPKSMAWALWLESNTPARWSKQSLINLKGV